jgi:hypothetical protein
VFLGLGTLKVEVGVQFGDESRIRGVGEHGLFVKQGQDSPVFSILHQLINQNLKIGKRRSYTFNGNLRGHSKVDESPIDLLFFVLFLLEGEHTILAKHKIDLLHDPQEKPVINLTESEKNKGILEGYKKKINWMKSYQINTDKRYGLGQGHHDQT